ncbi:MAG: nicotinate phosphoribosyltransferase [Clostridia bacterium]|nr:nicotinate phosphoribosyltransferase [Clostridia bacterium]
MYQGGYNFVKISERHLTMLFDFYELTMGRGYFNSEIKNKIAYFDVFFRKVPDGGGYAICAGLEQIIEYIKSIKFEKEDIDYLRSKGIFDEEFLNYLSTFKFTGDIWAVPEGTVVFPNEPIMTVRAPAIEAQFIETFVLLIFNHQCLVATKASRIVRAAQGRAVSEFGSRRAHGPDAAIYGARASYIGGCNSTACTLSDIMFGVPAGGTMAHSWVQMFDTEYEAFKTYCQLYPKSPTLLIDTYNVLESGLPNAIKAFTEVLSEEERKNCAVRLDSGDITYLTKKIRKRLDNAGLTGCRITVSNSLDEYIIRDIIMQGACVDAFGVGERMITSKSEPVFGCVYKLAAVENDEGKITPKIKISENIVKITTPDFKKLYRFYSKDTGKAEADLLTIHDEVINKDEPYELFDPVHVWKRKTMENYELRELLVPIFVKGECVYNSPSVKEIRDNCKRELESMWDEVLRFENPHNYYVDLSQRLWDEKHELLKKRNR